MKAERAVWIPSNDDETNSEDAQADDDGDTHNDDDHQSCVRAHTNAQLQLSVFAD